MTRGRWLLAVTTCVLLGCGSDSQGTDAGNDTGAVDQGNVGDDVGPVADMGAIDTGPGDMASSDDTGPTSDDDLGIDCAPNEFLDGSMCVACEPGTTSLGGDVTTCSVTLCAANEYVSNHVCTACDAGDANTAGDDASGADTICDATSDACFAVLGVDCATFDEAYVKASNTDANDLFGFSVSLDGDTLAIGAYKESSDATGVDGNQTSNQYTESGAVYVFTRSGTTWTQQAYLKASNTGLLDYFGYSLALDGDTIAVGAYGENSNATGVDGNQNDETAAESGAVYVFTRSGTTWSQQAYLKASNTDGNDFFGGSLALSGETLAVGANREDSVATGINGNQTDNTAMDSGAVYVFTRAGATWTQQAYLKASNSEAGDNFGISVALDVDSLAVGAYQEDSSATGVDGNEADNAADGAGAVYVFTRSGTDWSQQAYIKSSDASDQDIFGYSVAIEGDTLAVGAHLQDDSGTNSGAAYVFTRSGALWSQQALLKASNPEGGDNFGFAVALSGDLLAVTAASEDGGTTDLGDDTDNGGVNSGAAYLFSRAAGSWTQMAYIKASNTDPADGFGRSVALDGSTLVVGAIEEDGNTTGVNGDQASNGASRSGAVYVRRVAP